MNVEENQILKSEEIFQNKEEMMEALEALILFINQRYRKKAENASPNVLAFTLDALKVEFSEAAEQLELKTAFSENTLTIVAPRSAKESEESLRDREERLLKTFGLLPKESEMAAVLHLYRTLNLRGRRELTNDYRRFKKKQAASD